MKTLHAARHDGLDSILPWRNVCLSLHAFLPDYLSVYLGQLCGSLEVRYSSVVLCVISSLFCRDGNDHEVDQNLATDFFADFPTELPTMVTVLAVLGYGYILTDDQ